MPEQESIYAPEYSYDINLKIKDLDYSSDLKNISLVSSLSTGYQIFTLELLLDPNDIILEEIFGKEPLKLSIRLLAEQGIPLETLDFELLYIDSEYQNNQKQTMSEGAQKDRQSIVINTVCRKPFVSLNKTVNDVFENKTVRQIIEEIGNNVGVDVYFDSDNENQEVVRQICIPPISFYKVVKEYDHNHSDPMNGFLDQRFGLFDGVPGVFCQYDNKLYIKNLTKRLEKTQTISVYQLSSDMDNTEIIEKSLDGDVFYTYDNIDNSFSGNAKIAVMAPEMKFIVKPRDTLSHTITKNFNDIMKNYACGTNSKKVEYDSDIDSRVSYIKGDSGNDYSESQFNSRIGRSLSDLSTISLNLERNLLLSNLINVGECVKLIPNTIEYIDYNGKYILWSSQVNFSFNGNWQTTCKINLIRSNNKM